jgi:GNAT superfamily N-acetyltransferase
MSQNTTPFDIRVIDHGSPEWRNAVDMRRAILRTPLGLDFVAEDLAREAADTHFAAFSNSRMIGTVVLTPYAPGVVKLRQMAVAEDRRGQGVGEALLSAFEDHARATGIHKIILAARQTARRFYECNGYTAEGDGFIEVTIPHIQMHKRL